MPVPAVQLGLMGVGAIGAVAGTTYVYQTYYANPPAKTEGLVHLAALALSGEVVNKTLSDAEFKSSLARFGLSILTHPDTLQTLKVLAVSEFTNDTPVRASLKKFVVKDIIEDPWVKEELLDLVSCVVADVIGDTEIYPSAVLTWLGRGALDGLLSDQFQVALRRRLTEATWDAFLGLPPPDSTFLKY